MIKEPQIALEVRSILALLDVSRVLFQSIPKAIQFFWKSIALHLKFMLGEGPIDWVSKSQQQFHVWIIPIYPLRNTFIVKVRHRIFASFPWAKFKPFMIPCEALGIIIIKKVQFFFNIPNRTTYIRVLSERFREPGGGGSLGTDSDKVQLPYFRW